MPQGHLAAVRSLRFATYLAPNVRPVYDAVVRHVGEALGRETTLDVGVGYGALEDGREDVAFVCGLPYVLLAERAPAPVEVLAAPVLAGERYRGEPVYFSDVIVPRDHPARRFDDLRGASWAYNEPDSQSGYGITRAALVDRGETGGFFGRVVEAGYHQRSIRLVADGGVDASAVDSQVLEIELRDHPELAGAVRVIDSLGPSTIQPVVASRRLEPALRRRIRDAVLDVDRDPAAIPTLRRGLVERFVAARDRDYDDIRGMLERVRRSGMEGFGPVAGWTGATPDDRRATAEEGP
jgi:phosphonate transport system substrate-binding protein